MPPAQSYRGGPGAIFWMWLSAFFGMATIYSEATAAQKYRQETPNGIVGGPAYYIRAAFTGRFGKVLAAIFAVFVVLALGFMGNMVQSNSIGDAFQTAFGIPTVVTGFVIAVVAGFIFIGGVKRIASFSEKIVPIMAVFYVVGSLVIIGINYQNILGAFQSIFVGAFHPQAVVGGAVGIGVKEAVRFGVARGLFSNEAGMGSTPHAHAMAKVKHPCDQGNVAMMGVFVDTFVVLTMTALVILTTGVLQFDGLTGAPLAQAAFSSVMGDAGSIFIAICTLFFALTTIIGWYFFGQANILYLFGKKAVIVYSIIVLGFIAVGSVLKVDLVWQLADFFNGLMVIPNLIGLLALSGVIVKLHQERRQQHLDPVAKPDSDHNKT